MGNASKALLMAGGILLGILILTLLITLFTNSKSISNSYEETKKAELIQQFNVNFTKYLGQELTIHQVVTICNFAKKENNKVHDVVTDMTPTTAEIKSDVDDYHTNIRTYKINIISYSEDGYIQEINFIITN